MLGSTTLHENAGRPPLPGYGHAAWALIRALLFLGLVLFAAGLPLAALLDHFGLSVAVTSHWSGPLAWPLGRAHLWYELTNVFAAACAAGFGGWALRFCYDDERARIDPGWALVVSAATLAIGTRSWFWAVVVGAALAHHASVAAEEPRPRALLPRRAVAAALAGTALVLLAGCFVAADRYPLGVEVGSAADAAGSGLVSARERDGVEVLPYRAGRSAAIAVFPRNSSWRRTLTLLSVDPTGGVPGAPWRLSMTDESGLPAARPAPPLRLAPLAHAAVWLRLHFRGCVAGTSGESFTLGAVRFRYRAGDGAPRFGEVPLAQPVRTTCP